MSYAVFGGKGELGKKKVVHRTSLDRKVEVGTSRGARSIGESSPMGPGH